MEAIPVVVVVVAVSLGRATPAASGELVPVPRVVSPVEVLATIVPPVEAIAVVPHVVVEVITVLVPPAVVVINTTVACIVRVATSAPSEILTAVTPPILKTTTSASIHDDTIHNCGKNSR